MSAAVTHRLVFMGFAALVGACAQAPTPTQTPPMAAPMPDRYKHASAQSDDPLPQPWWRMYGDPVLNALVETTLRDNPYTQVAQLRLLAAKAQHALAQADRLPQVNGSLGFSHSRTSSTTALGEVLGHNTIRGDKYTAGFEAGWQIDVWNRVARQLDAADAGIEAEHAYARMVAQVLSWEVAVNYWQFRQAEMDLRLLGDMRRQRAEARSVQVGRFEHGLTSEIDVVQADLALSDIDTDIEEARRRMALAEHELATLMVRAVKDFAVPPAVANRLPDVPTLSPGIPASILARRPDLSASAQNVRALLAQKEIADTAFYPSISLTGNFGFASLELRNLTRGDSRQFSLGPIAISLPILDGGRIRASQDIADARYQAALNVHKVQVLIALREVDDALSNLASYRREASQLQEALASAQQGSDMAHARHERGVTNYLEVARADHDLSNTQRKVARNQLRGLLASTQLIYVLGGDWHPTPTSGPAHPPPAPSPNRTP